jgi:hypothetical protein
MSDSYKITFRDGRNRQIEKTVNCVIDIRDFADKAGFAWLMIAANPHLSLAEMRNALAIEGEQHERSASWIARRRWMFHTPKPVGAPKNRDRRDEQVLAFCAQHPKMSSRQIAGFLRTKGITRSATWVRTHRVPAH